MLTKRVLLGGGSRRGHGLWELVELEGDYCNRKKRYMETRSEIWRG